MTSGDKMHPENQRTHKTQKVNHWFPPTDDWQGRMVVWSDEMDPIDLHRWRCTYNLNGSFSSSFLSVFFHFLVEFLSQTVRQRRCVCFFLCVAQCISHRRQYSRHHKGFFRLLIIRTPKHGFYVSPDVFPANYSWCHIVFLKESI